MIARYTSAHQQLRLGNSAIYFRTVADKLRTSYLFWCFLIGHEQVLHQLYRMQYGRAEALKKITSRRIVRLLRQYEYSY